MMKNQKKLEMMKRMIKKGYSLFLVLQIIIEMLMKRKKDLKKLKMKIKIEISHSELDPIV
jgi:hypothetical protein